MFRGIARFFKNMSTNMGILSEFMGFLWQRKLWWIIPMVTVLLIVGILFVLVATSGAGPFVYTLF